MLSKKDKIKLGRETDTIVGECLKLANRGMTEKCPLEEQAALVARERAGARVFQPTEALSFYHAALEFAETRLNELHTMYSAAGLAILTDAALCIQWALRAVVQRYTNALMCAHDVNIVFAQTHAGKYVPRLQFWLISTKKDDEMDEARMKLNEARKKLAEAEAAVESAMKKRKEGEV